MKVVIADDELRLRKIVSMFLKKNGFEVFEASNGKVAVDLVEKVKPNVVVLDINMPEMDGFEAAEKIRGLAELKNIPIIFLTAKTDTDSMNKSEELGASFYLTKPFSPKELVDKINTVLG